MRGAPYRPSMRPQRHLREKLREEVKVRPLASLEPQRGSPKLPPKGHKRPPHRAEDIKNKGEGREADEEGVREAAKEPRE